MQYISLALQRPGRKDAECELEESIGGRGAEGLVQGAMTHPQLEQLCHCQEEERSFMKSEPPQV